MMGRTFVLKKTQTRAKRANEQGAPQIHDVEPDEPPPPRSCLGRCFGPSREKQQDMRRKEKSTMERIQAKSTGLSAYVRRKMRLRDAEKSGRAVLPISDAGETASEPRLSNGSGEWQRRQTSNASSLGPLRSDSSFVRAGSYTASSYGTLGSPLVEGSRRSSSSGGGKVPALYETVAATGVHRQRSASDSRAFQPTLSSVKSKRINMGFQTSVLEKKVPRVHVPNNIAKAPMEGRADSSPLDELPRILNNKSSKQLKPLDAPPKGVRNNYMGKLESPSALPSPQGKTSRPGSARPGSARPGSARPQSGRGPRYRKVVQQKSFKGGVPS